MYKIKFYRPTIRLTESVEAINSTSEGIGGSDSNHIYGMRVQIRICGLWLTIWKEQCAPEDADARTNIKARAAEVMKALEYYH